MAGSTHLDAILARIEQESLQLQSGGKVKDAPDFLYGLQRGIQIIDRPPESITPHRYELAAARELLQHEITSYLSQEEPDELLLVRALPGVGKTTAAVMAAESPILAGRRVLYAGPRHDFFTDLMRISSCPSDWYEWLPRQEGGDHQEETCQHATSIMRWLHKGYKAMDFCSRVCGWDYVNESCPYHRQKKQRERIIFGMHQHVFLGHPLEFNVVIGDEYPASAFSNAWSVPTKSIMPLGMNPLDTLAEMLHTMQGLSTQGQQIHGLALLSLLGGAEAILEAVKPYRLLAEVGVTPPDIFSSEDADRAPYNVLPALVPLLEKEAKASLEQKDDYLHRIYLTDQGLDLLLRNRVNDQMPAHMIWLDGTGDADLYRAIFGRKVRMVDATPKLKGKIYQLYERANGKSALLDKANVPTSRVKQAEELVRAIITDRGYTRPAVISFQQVVDQGEFFRTLPHLHFFGARGTNVFEDVDALFILGRPQPPLWNIKLLSKMVFFDRMEQFADDWSTKLVPYVYQDEQGRGRAYPVSGFWQDQDLQTVLEALCKAEILQAAHRARPVNHRVDIWLLVNEPIDGLPPDELLSMKEVMSAPDGVNVFSWRKAVEAAELLDDRRDGVTASALAELIGVSHKTALAYIEKLLSSGEWEVKEREITRKGQGPKGRPPMQITKTVMIMRDDAPPG